MDDRNTVTDLQDRPGLAADVPECVEPESLDSRVLEYREFFIRHLIRDLRERLPHSGPGLPTCLDVGCQDGRYTHLLSKHGFAVEGVDAPDSAILEAKERHPGLKFHEGDAKALPFDDSNYDAIVCLGLIQRLADWRQAIREVIRVLKPGGVALIETNRAFPFCENLLKCIAHAMRRQMPLREINRIFHAHRVGGEGDAGMRKFSVTEMVSFFRETSVAKIVVHDPRKEVVFHDFIWAAAVTKRLRGESRGGEISPNNVDSENCLHCRRHGVVSIKAKLA
jgi:SAM-dependent methyltransferase